jgi:hypothetical protein
VDYVGIAGTSVCTGILQLQLFENNTLFLVVVLVRKKKKNTKLFTSNANNAMTHLCLGKRKTLFRSSWNFMMTTCSHANAKNHSFLPTLILGILGDGEPKGPMRLCIVYSEHPQVLNANTVTDPILNLKIRTNDVELAAEMGVLEFNESRAAHVKETEESLKDKNHIDAPTTNQSPPIPPIPKYRHHPQSINRPKRFYLSLLRKHIFNLK